MKKLLAAAFIAAIAAALTLPSCTSPLGVRLMSYNTDRGVGTDSLLDIDRIAGVIVAQTPDVVALQCPPADLNALAAKTSMSITSDGHGNVAILSREKPLGDRTIPLPGKGQGLVIVEFKKYFFAGVLFSPVMDDRLAATAILKATAAGLSKPFFFGGSLSAGYGSQTVTDMARDFTPLVDLDARTWPAPKPLMLVDYLFMYNRNVHDFNISALKTITNPATSADPSAQPQPAASSHLPVVAELSFR